MTTRSKLTNSSPSDVEEISSVSDDNSNADGDPSEEEETTDVSFSSFGREFDRVYSLDAIYSEARNMVPVIKPYALYCYNATGLYLFWICLHYVAAQMYVYYCVPSFFQGFVMTPFLVSAPHCKAIRWVVHNGGNTIDNMWIVLATWLCSRLLVNTDKK